MFPRISLQTYNLLGFVQGLIYYGIVAYRLDIMCIRSGNLLQDLWNKMERTIKIPLFHTDHDNVSYDYNIRAGPVQTFWDGLETMRFTRCLHSKCSGNNRRVG